MTTKFRIIFIALFITAIALAVFLYFRSMSITASHLNKMNHSIKRIEKGFISFSQKKKTLRKKELNQFVKEAKNEFSRIAVIAVTTENYSKKYIDKNEKYLPGSAILENIIEDFSRAQIPATGNEKFIERDYKISEINPADRGRFYLFHIHIKPYRILVVFPHAFDREDITRLALEMLLVLLICIIIFTSLYVTLVRQGRVENAVNYIDLRYNKNAVSREESQPKTKTITGDTLASCILPVFEQIAQNIHTEEITLYLKGTESTYTKAFEYRQSTFLKIESDHFQTIEVSRDKRKELHESAAIIMQDGSRLIIPVVDEESLLAIINITSSHAISGNEIKLIEDNIKSLVSDVKDYLVLNNVMIDRHTGLFSTSYYHLRYNELLKIKEQNNTDFSVLFIAPGSHLQLSASRFSSLIKTISPLIQQRLRGGDLLALYDNFIAVLMPDTDSRRAAGISSVLLKKLSRMRIRLDEQTGIHLKPLIAKASTDSSGEKNIQQKALAALKQAIEEQKKET